MASTSAIIDHLGTAHGAITDAQQVASTVSTVMGKSIELAAAFWPRNLAD